MTADPPTPADSPFVHTDVVDDVGWIELDRPRALNALDTGMVQAIGAALARWPDQGVVRTVIRSSSERAFCAGGDIRAVRERALAGDDGGNRAFFSSEYATNRAVAEHRPPYIALIDGVCLGGGLGLSAHGTVRIVTERASLGMPETAIGFFPDIGATWFLPRLPGAIGTYLALTGRPLSAADAIACGLATHFVPAADLDPLTTALGSPQEPLDQVLGRFAQSPAGSSELADHREAIDGCFSAHDADEVLHRLDARGDDWSARTAEVLRSRSPWSVYVIHSLLRTPVGSLAEALDRELRVALALTRTPDFVEGVRAVLVDRDHSPRWQSDWGEQCRCDAEAWLAAVLATEVRA